MPAKAPAISVLLSDTPPPPRGIDDDMNVIEVVPPELESGRCWRGPETHAFHMSLTHKRM